MRGYVEDLDKLPLEVDCVVHSHTLEHMYDPARFFEIVRSLLSEGQLHIFSVPNLFALVNDGQPSLHFEHVAPTTPSVWEAQRRLWTIAPGERTALANPNLQK